tara:strand:+ start:45170 stop:45727 length:558 start_codon:yes stop_codon:yes gene_type:complete
MNPIFFENPKEFRSWLEKNHLVKTELLVGFYKVRTKRLSITWSESVDQALCFGWIDGVRKSIDAESYCIRFTPRKTTSIWSAINIKKIEELTNSNLMTDAGHKAFSYRTEKKSKIYAYEKESVNLDPVYTEHFKKNKVAWEFFVKQAPSYKRVMVHWIMSAKKEETRISRLEKTIFESAQERRIR